MSLLVADNGSCVIERRTGAQVSACIRAVMDDNGITGVEVVQVRTNTCSAHPIGNQALVSILWGRDNCYHGCSCIRACAVLAPRRMGYYGRTAAHCPDTPDPCVLS
ncbi:hypothetical protein SXCC_03553 [Gluconacetobacter sp. SXCC-1]|nr:hypothetical protein SXCC_03553 [Gluconacetobacter sp. SXCC-1]